MKFEYDPAKSQSNKAKHGIDFETAKSLWDDAERLEIPSVHPVEPRYMVTGFIGNECWTAVITYRADAVRIISVRRARTEEVLRYAQRQYPH